jgi:hypothetical protein
MGSTLYNTQGDVGLIWFNPVAFSLPTCVGVTRSEAPDSRITLDFGRHTTMACDGTVPLASVTALPGAHCYYVRYAKHGDLPTYGAVRRALRSSAHSYGCNAASRPASGRNPRRWSGAVLNPAASRASQ